MAGGSRRFLFSVMMFPAVENTRSEGTGGELGQLSSRDGGKGRDFLGVGCPPGQRVPTQLELRLPAELLQLRVALGGVVVLVGGTHHLGEGLSHGAFGLVILLGQHGLEDFDCSKPLSV